MVNCPRCGSEVEGLVSLPKSKSSQDGSTYSEVCANCFQEASGASNLTSGGVLFAQEKAKEKHRLQLWKSRVGLIKRGRALMSQKLFGQAAASYEKYLRILELVFSLKKGENLKPELFKNSARTSELTVVASVYWDLLRIYDSNDKYIERQRIAARQLALFVQYTPIYPDIIRKAHQFTKNAKNPSVFKEFLKASSQERPRCFIATATFDSIYDPRVQILRAWRDHFLKKFYFGRKLILFYYLIAPWIAEQILRFPFLKGITRLILLVFCSILFRFWRPH